jgi:hypothetical protein
MISGELLKYLNGLLIEPAYHEPAIARLCSDTAAPPVARFRFCSQPCD